MTRPRQPEAQTQSVPRQRRRTWAILLLGLMALAAAAAFMIRRARPPAVRLTLTAGFAATTRALVAQRLVAVLTERGADARLVEVQTTARELERVNAGVVDFCIVSEAYRITDLPHLREVGLLYVEALHLFVKTELAASVDPSLAGLRGHSIDLGPFGSSSHGLAAAVLTFAGFPLDARGAPGGFVTHNLEYPELETLLDARDRAALPDALFHLATVPSKVGRRLVRDLDYALVGLPFAEAFRLGAMLGDGFVSGEAAAIDVHEVHDTVIPAFTYQTEPAVPPELLHTLGTRLILVTHDRVPAETVEAVLDAVFNSSFTRFTQPPLERDALTLAPKLALHPGTIAYLAHDQPFMTNDKVDQLNNTVGIIGALAGGSLFLWQWWRQRRQHRRDAVFAHYMQEIAAVERRVAALELSAQLQLEPLVEEHKHLLRLKSEALDRFAAGDLGDQAALSDLLTPVNAARRHIGDLILHLRENLEQQADAEGRSAQAVWAEAMKARDDSPDEGG